MQVNKVNTNLPINANIGRNNNNKQNTSFKAGMPLDPLCLGVANLIENGGLAVSFTLQDMLGTNLPRPIMGLRRNKKENNGQANKSFAAKEMVREFLTGPSMFLIPLGTLAVTKRIFGKACSVPANFIKAFGNIHAENALTQEGAVAGKTDFFKNTFTEIIKNAKGETEITSATQEKAAEFAQRLSDGIKDADGKGVKELISNLSDDFVNIAKSHANDAAHTDFTIAQVKNGVASPFKTTVNHMMSYADDVVEKASVQAPDKAKEFIKKLADKKTVGRFGLNILMYASILTFLQIIPKLYNKAEGDKNAGLKGLMKEETLNDKELNARFKNDKNDKKNKSNPSFGSLATFAKKITGNGLLGKFARVMEFEGCNVSFPLLLGIMGFGILIPRTLRAKDKYDREEILRRDLVTCAVMCFAEKELRKGFSKLNETKSGLVLAAKEKGFQDKSFPQKVFEYLRPIKGVRVLTTDQIRSKYTNIDQYKDGIKGFCDFISGQGGNLGKVFGLTEESKTIVNDLLQKEGKDIATADNKVITDIIGKAKDSDGIKRLADLFKEKDNAWVKTARTLNARFTALSILVLVPVFLGFLLPAINERATKKRIKQEQEFEAAKNASMNAKKFDFMNQDKNRSSVFADMEKYTK